MLSSNSKPAIHTDSQARHLYANDASMYGELPQGVAFPENEQEIQSLVQKANQEDFSITPRSAGTSLAGQTTGNGVIIDVSRHMNRLMNVNTEDKTARVQPGVIRDTLNRKAGKYKLEFGPDTATTSRCMLGGMIGNNSCGLFSIKHKTTREHVVEIEAVLSDGSMAVFKPLTNDELQEKKQLDNLEGHIYRSVLQLIERNREQIINNYPHPEIIRRNTGYALDCLCEMQPFNKNGRLFNMAELLCGSEGTLAVTASAKVRLTDKSSSRIVLAPHFSSINDAMEATVEAVKQEPAAVELVDDIILEATKDNIEQRKNRFFLVDDPKCILIIQFEGDTQKEVTEKANRLKKKLIQEELATVLPVIDEKKKMNRVWELRKAGLGLLMGLGADERTPSFCEDTAVRVDDLPEYIRDFQKLLNKYHTYCCFYGHASVGELHLRPVIDIQTTEGVKKMELMGNEVAELVKKYNGSLSGEHGDGRVRAPYIEKVLGKKMMPLLKKVKEIWDPNYIFNPGKIVDPRPVGENLRIAAASKAKETKLEPTFKWRKEGGFAEALDLCNGAGVCRKLAESGGTMCPSYMATKEEKDSTRGRANLFRQLFSGKNKDLFTSEELYDALDLCISCKGCKSECPANVDMARMKAEFMQGWHEQEGISWTERFFGQASTLYPLASRFNKITNWIVSSNIGKELLYQGFNISRKRVLPKFADKTFIAWFHNRSSKYSQVMKDLRPTSTPARRRQGFGRQAAGRKVVLFIDIFTNYHEPDIGKAAVRFLEKAGCNVIIPDFHELGRPQVSKGLLDEAKNILDKNLPKLATFVNQGIPIVGLEPSEVLTLSDEYLDLCDDNQLSAAQKVADNSFTFSTFAANLLSEDNFTPDVNATTNVYIHDHCHNKALNDSNDLIAALQQTGYEPELLNTGCCGMAGSFGYEAGHYGVSMNIGELALFPSFKKLSVEALICAPGFSCRHQIMHGTGREAFHPAKLLAEAFT